jgi:hypothetical protein
MTWKFLPKLIVFSVISAALFSCGTSNKQTTSMILSGHVDLAGKSPQALGPVFVSVLNKSPVELGDSFSDALVTVQTLDTETCDFSVDLSGKGLKPGDPVYIVVFADNDYKGSIPDPGEGDLVGYYLNTETLSPAFILQEGDNSGIEIRLTKEVFSFEASVSGQVDGDGDGSLTIFAYAGDVSTLDISGIDPDAIVGYTQVLKTAGEVDYTLSILPYGRNVPMENVYLMAFLDRNRNNRPDAGDRLGFYSANGGLPSLITIMDGHVSGYTITLSMDIPEPSGYPISMSGTVSVATGLNVDNNNIFILVVRASDTLNLNALIHGDMSDVAYFYKMPAGKRDFAFDLSKSGLASGDRVMVLALFDRQYAGGFPDMGVGDYVGYYQNRTDMAVDLVLSEGLNSIETGNDNDFKLSRVLVNHSASLRFQLDDINLRNNLDVSLDPGEHVTVVAVYKEGVHINSDPVIDMDYIIGFGSVYVPETGNNGHVYSMDLLPAMDARIPVQNPFAIDGVYVFAIFDGNLNNEADENNYVGYYWRTIFLFYMYPKEIARLMDGITTLDQTVRFSTDNKGFF